MAERMLVISGDEDWRAGLIIALGGSGHETWPSEGSGRWRALALNFGPTAAIINADNPRARGAAGTTEATTNLVAEVRAAFPALPVVLVTVVPRDRLAELAGTWLLADIVLDQDGDPTQLARGISEALERLRPPEPRDAPSEWATVEVTLCEAHLQCQARVGGLDRSFGPFEWDRRDLSELNDEFKGYESQSSEMARSMIQVRLEPVSRVLLRHAFEKPLASAHAFCAEHLATGGVIHHRFTVADGDLEFVPFELVATANQGEYLRAVQPLARKLAVRQAHRSPDSPPRASEPLPKRVLFVLSDASGAFHVPFHRFHGNNPVSVPALRHIARELAATLELHGEGHVRVVRLQAGGDAVAELEAAFAGARYDIIHFAGHSIRSATTGDVFLVLPGPAARSTLPYNAEDFARRASEASARLVILSSCEGASCRALARLAAFGIPAVAGFRWEVADADAAEFTGALHRALREGIQPRPVLQAFHEALRALKERSAGRLSWFSPILMLQPAAWHDYTLEV